MGYYTQHATLALVLSRTEGHPVYSMSHSAANASCDHACLIHALDLATDLLVYQASCKVPELLTDSEFKAEKNNDQGPDDFGCLQLLNQDVMTLKRNLALDLGKDDLVNKVVAKRPRKTEEVVAQSPREAFTIKTLKSLVKFTEKRLSVAEGRFEGREITALARDLRQDDRDVRQDKRDVLQDNRDVLQDKTRMTLAETKRQLDASFEKYSTWKAACEQQNMEEQQKQNMEEQQKQNTEEQQKQNTVEQQKQDTEEKQPQTTEEQENTEEQQKQNTEEQQKQNTKEKQQQTREEQQNLEEKHEQNMEEKQNVASFVTQGLDRAESAVNLGERVVNLGEKASNVATRAGNLSRPGDNSRILQTFLGAVVACASAVARQALQDLKDMVAGGEDSSDSHPTGDDSSDDHPTD
ncbi:transcription factor SPT20 homolog [Lolium rigidum]|uniref:transcription factor SPT20 homolog n=1 Tax=Lolium rigidum TaxID=89674 RepID=UPI001F5D449A|nr:transcription factor SPT20 homolog [Lolium rigidum]